MATSDIVRYRVYEVQGTPSAAPAPSLAFIAFTSLFLTDSPTSLHVCVVPKLGRSREMTS